LPGSFLKKQTIKIHKYEKRFTHESALIQDGGAGNLLNAGDVLQQVERR
jgi:hypothetical protein